MSQNPRRRQLPPPSISRPEADMEHVFSQLFPEPIQPGVQPLQPPTRRMRRIIRDGDGGVTAVEYVATVDPKTGEQDVNVNVLTNKRECPRCGRLVTPLKLYECENCWKRVCGSCLTSRPVFLGEKPVCLDCA